MNTMPTWASTILVILLALMMASLAAYVVINAINKAIEAEAKLQHKKRLSETNALNRWKTAYEAERSDHLKDVSDLTDQIFTLKREIELKDAILKKAKVADL